MSKVWIFLLIALLLSCSKSDTPLIVEDTDTLYALVVDTAMNIKGTKYTIFITVSCFDSTGKQLLGTYRSEGIDVWQDGTGEQIAKYFFDFCTSHY